MNNSEICKIVGNRLGIKVADIEDIITAYHDEITDQLMQGNDVYIKGLGGFGTKHTKDRLGADPRTGEKREYKGRRLPTFKFSANYQNKF